MKRALSLIIVLAMVLCMIPFSVFAEEVDGTFGFGGDWIDGVITLTEADGFGLEFLWTASEAGTVTFTAEAVVPEVAEDEEVPALAEPYILVDEEEYDGSAIEVAEGEQLSIIVADGAYIGGEVTIVANLVGLVGTQSNPYKILNPKAEMGESDVVTIAAGESAYCSLMFFGTESIVINGTGVVFGDDAMEYGTITENIDGTTTVAINTGIMNAPIVITNSGDAEATYTFDLVVAEAAVGTEENPEVINSGIEYTATIAQAGEAYWYKYIAEGNGYISVSIDAGDLGWMYQVDNKSVEVGGMGDTQWSDSDPVVNPQVIAVSEGDDIRIMAATYDPNAWDLPAGNVTVKVEFSVEEPTDPSEPEEPEAAELVLGDNVNIAPGSYTFNATEAGGLSVAVTSLIVDGEDLTSQLTSMAWFMNFGLYVNGSGDGSAAPEAVNVAAGDVVTIDFTSGPSMMGHDIKATLTLTLGEEVVIVPGTQNNPIVIDSLNWEATHEGAHDVYYSYTASDYCLIKVTNAYVYDVEYKTYDANTKYVEMYAGDTAIINAYATTDGTYTYSAEIVDELPAGNGSYNFPIVIEALPYEAENTTDSAKYYRYTAAEDSTLIFSGEGYSVTEVGGWDSILSDENSVELTAGTEISICLYDGSSFKVALPVIVATVGGQDFTDLQLAINAAQLIATNESPVTVVMLSDYVTDGTIIIPANVIVDIATMDLTAGYLFVLSGGNIYSATGRYTSLTSTTHGTIKVAKDNVVMTNDAAVITNATNGMSAIPIWLPDDSCYVFTTVRVLESESLPYALDKEKHTVSYTWKNTGASVFNTLLKTTGGTDIGVRFCVKVSWFTGVADVDLSFWYTPEMVQDTANGQYCGFGLSGLDILGANYAESEAYDTFSVRACFVTDCGVCVYGFAK